MRRLQFEHANANFVTDRLAVGGDLDAYDPRLAEKQLDELVAAGITHILDVRVEWSDQELVARLAPEVAYYHLGVNDIGQRQEDAWFTELTQWAAKVFADPDAKVLAHCHMGINRGPSAGFAIMLDQGWDPVEALTAIRRSRPIAFIDYAEDALDWHLRRSGADEASRTSARDAVRAWREGNGLDVGEVIRGIREHEAAQASAGAPPQRVWVLRVPAASVQTWTQALRDYLRESGADSTPVLTFPARLEAKLDEIGVNDAVALWVPDAEPEPGICGLGVVSAGPSEVPADVAGFNPVPGVGYVNVDCLELLPEPKVLRSRLEGLIEFTGFGLFDPEADLVDPIPLDGAQVAAIITAYEGAELPA